VVIASCKFGPGISQDWRVFGPGEVLNLEDNLCLAVASDCGQGTGLIQESCYGKPGEIWGLN
jgi:hypothetical protein